MKKTSVYPQKTHELRLHLHPEGNSNYDMLKEEVAAFLKSEGIDAFVEGAIDDLDIDNEPGGVERNFYDELGGARQPLSVFKYSREMLEDLNIKLARGFSGRVTTEFHSMDTETWMEGWKESFKPFETERFVVFPPWESPALPVGKLPLIVEPGMAFGTGQHATTRLCLAMLEALLSAEGQTATRVSSVLDVGTGTGILSIAARKLGVPSVHATDIDPDALIAAHGNMELNQEKGVHTQRGSVPRNFTVGLVIANILTVVLKKLMPDLAGAVQPEGLLMLSGLLNEDEEELAEQAASFGLVLSEVERLSGWSCLLLKRP